MKRKLKEETQTYIGIGDQGALKKHGASSIFLTEPGENIARKLKPNC